jgi:hypothetical protein
MTLAAGAEVQFDYKPLHHAGNCNQYRADTDQYVCNFACLYFPLYVLGAARSNLQPDIKPTKRPVERLSWLCPLQREDVN